MKLALCLEYPIGLRGGVSVLVEVLAKELVAHGHQVILVSPDAIESLQKIGGGGLISGHIRWQPSPVTRGSAWELVQQLIQAEVRLAHFHIGGTYGWGNRSLWHCPITMLAGQDVCCITTVHMANGVLDGFCGSEKPTWFKLLMLPFAWIGKSRQLRHTRFEIAVSRRDQEKLQRWYSPWRERFVQVYHSRLHREAGDDRPAKRQPVILNVGHLALRKGQLVLAEAFARIAAQHPKWTLQLAGHDGGDGASQKILQLAKQSGLDGRICLLGRRDDSGPLMQQASVFVQPSFHEGLPLALQEALYHRCACVATRIPGNVELVEDDVTGVLVPPGNAEALSVALDKLLKNSALRERLATRGHDSILARGMTAAHMVEHHQRLYDSALHAR